ncbi:uncharacterized protein KQ657_001302 [Scheffersomyces spartinae]|uniref:Glutamate decarboxylase n=1 Tax=Scheffersomyces spartinae TaxID=45513 RepID=A0A9P7V7L8_9ASCO|nr:uncharacterized protein KQ657_001302 [Scheffersomyces spartinae]KAG7192845.1 hypothetical protein KQ657_001302 [Scheffersomyces spartinae]
MVISHHIDSEELEEKVLHSLTKTPLDNKEQYIFKYDANALVPKYEIPIQSLDEELVYRYMSEGLALDGNPKLNLASFVNTELSPVQRRLVEDSLVKNLADNDEYPSLIDLQQRCITILSNLWHAPKTTDPVTGKLNVNSIGVATTGSSEAVMLGGLLMKKRWTERRKKEGKSTENPNIIMASCVQVALEKFARYFDVENRLVSISESLEHMTDVNKIKENVDENTIGIFVILGSTFTGAFDNVELISKTLDEIQEETGFDVPIHVDGASGGFVAPFVYPHLKWDFAVSRVVSINTSGHKFGLTSAGLGWIVWRDSLLVPQSLRFSLDYLGGVEETFGLNFSRPGFPVILQYFNFLTLGREGYTKIYNSCLQNARLLSEFLEETGYFEILSVIHKKIKTQEERDMLFTGHFDHKMHVSDSTTNEEYYPGLPVVAFRFSDQIRTDYPEIPQRIISTLLRNQGFIVPNYHLPPDEEEKQLLRVVVRDSVTLNLLEQLMQSIVKNTELLLSACLTVKDMIKHQEETSDDEKRELVYKIFLSIASNGTEDAREASILFKSKERTDGKSTRTVC